MKPSIRVAVVSPPAARMRRVGESRIVSARPACDHWRRYLEAFLRVLHQEGQVVIFCRKVSNLVEDEIRERGIELIEKHSNARLAVIDRQILWEGSINFLLPPDGEEHLRRSVSKLQCSEILDIHDLEV